MREFLVNFCNKKFICVFFLGFSSGIPLLLTASTLSNWLSREGLSVSVVGFFAAVGIPYSLKFLWSFIFDCYKIPILYRFLGQRNSWLIVVQLLLIFSINLLGLSNPLNELYYTSICAVLVSFFSASQDILIDAIRVETLNDDEQVIGAAMNSYGYRLAMYVSGAVALYLSEIVSWSLVYFFTSLYIFVGMIFSFVILKEIKNNSKVVMNEDKTIYNVVIGSIKEILTRKDSIIIILLVVTFKLPDAFISNVTSKLYVVAGYTNIEIANVVKSFGLGMTFLGSFFGGYMSRKFSFMKLLLLAAILQGLSNLAFLPIVDSYHDLSKLYFAIAVDNLSGAIGTVGLVAYLSILCNKEYTASQYALLSSLTSVGRTFLTSFSGVFVKAYGWNDFFVFSALLSIPSILILLYINKIFFKEK